MGPIVVVVANVLGHDTFEMPLVEDDEVIKQISPAATDEALSNTVLPGTAEAGPLGYDAETLISLQPSEHEVVVAGKAPCKIVDI
jgi:hypothetical protein